jgi:hypothetical protein
LSDLAGGGVKGACAAVAGDADHYVWNYGSFFGSRGGIEEKLGVGVDYAVVCNSVIDANEVTQDGCACLRCAEESA